MKYGIIKVKRAFLYEENGVDVVDEVFFGWSVMWEDEGEWIEVWTHYGYRGWMVLWRKWRRRRMGIAG